MEITREHLVQWVNQLHEDFSAEEILEILVQPEAVVVTSRGKETKVKTTTYIEVIG